MAFNRNRIEGFDLARALAVMGMVVVNFAAMMEIKVYPLRWMGPAVDFIYGRAATVFVMLAGVSLSLMAGKWANQDGTLRLKPYLFKRCALLLLAGTVLSYWWAADILHVYALFVALGAWITGLSIRVLGRLTLATAFISLPVCAALTVSYDLMDGILFVDDQHWAVWFLLDYATSRYYPLFPWITFFLFGMLLGRLDRANRFNCHRWAAMGALVCVVIEVFSAATMAWVEQHNWDIEGNWWIVFLRSEVFPVTPLFMFSSGASALTVISLCRQALRRAPARCLVPVLAFGRLSLTLYMTHLIFGFFFIQWILKNNGTPDAVFMLNAAGLFCCTGILASALWLRWFKRGPLEALFYRLAGGGRRSKRSRHRTHPVATTLPDQV